MVGPNAAANQAATKRATAAAATAEAEKNMTPEQIRIRELEDQLARATARRMDEDNERAIEAKVVMNPTPRETAAATRNPGELRKPGNILIHFIEDGFSALGKVFVRGEELEFDPEDPEFVGTKDKFGRSWVELDEGDQMEKYGKVFFRRGPWRGKSILDSKFEALRSLAEEEGFDLPTEAELLNAERARRAEGRVPPKMPPLVA